MKWFKHDSDANRDPKLEKVLMKYGAEGYALYWLCIELIAAPIDKNNLNFELEHDAEILAHRLKMDSAIVEEIMHYMANLGLFEMDATTRRVTCLKLANRLEHSIVKNPELKKIQELIKANPELSETIPDNPGQSRLEEKRLDIDNTSSLNGRAWETYVQHRKELNAPALTARGVSMSQKKLAGLSFEEQQKAVDLSISNGWRGLFPEKLNAQPKQKLTYAEQLSADMAEKGML